MNPFIDTITKIRGGAAVKAADQFLQQIKEAVEKTQKKGELTCKLTIEPVGGNQFKVSFEATPKIPVETVGATILYGDGARFSKNDPNQPEFNLRIENGTTETQDEEEDYAAEL